MTDMHVGYDETELMQSPYARFFNPKIAPLQQHVAEALLNGAVAHELMYPVEKVAELQSEDDWPVENGYTQAPDGSLRVFCLTEMPGVTPAMWEWWFAWHGSDPQRYRLWHPKAHVHVGWQDGRDDLTHYVGRTSNIVEYLGAQRVKLAISFVPPASLGLDEQKLAERGEVAICGRGSFANSPVRTGWLVHHIRPVPGGAEMRSRMWVGGSNVSLGDKPGPLGKAVGFAAGQLSRIKVPNPAELLVHAAQEMAHLAAILPELYETFNNTDSRE